MKFFRKIINRNLLILFYSLFLFSYVFSSSNSIKRKDQKKNQLNLKTSSNSNKNNNVETANLKIIDKEGNKEYSLHVSLDEKDFIDKSGLVLKTDDSSKLGPFPFLDKSKKGFFIGLPHIKFSWLKNDKGEKTNILKLVLYYKIGSEEKHYILELDFRGFIGIGHKFNEDQLKEKFINKIEDNDFRTNYRRILELLNTEKNNLSELDNQKTYFEANIQQINRIILDSQKKIANSKSKLEGLIPQIKKVFIQKGKEDKNKVFDEMEEIIDNSIKKKLELEIEMNQIKAERAALIEKMDLKYKKSDPVNKQYSIKNDEEGKNIYPLQEKAQKKELEILNIKNVAKTKLDSEITNELKEITKNLLSEDQKGINNVYSHLNDIYINIESEKNLIAVKEKDLIKNKEIFTKIAEKEKSFYSLFQQYAQIYSSNDQLYETLEDLSKNSALKKIELIKFIEEEYKLKWTNVKLM